MRPLRRHQNYFFLCFVTAFTPLISQNASSIRSSLGSGTERIFARGEYRQLATDVWREACLFFVIRFTSPSFSNHVSGKYEFDVHTVHHTSRLMTLQRSQMHTEKEKAKYCTIPPLGEGEYHGRVRASAHIYSAWRVCWRPGLRQDPYPRLNVCLCVCAWDAGHVFVRRILPARGASLEQLVHQFKPG